MQSQDNLILLRSPLLLLDVRIEVVVPALATLLADATRQVGRDERPFLSWTGEETARTCTDVSI
jgi:hypothetical protein